MCRLIVFHSISPLTRNLAMRRQLLFFGMGQLGRAIAQRLSTHCQQFEIVGIDPNPDARLLCKQIGIDCYESLNIAKQDAYTLIVMCLPTTASVATCVELVITSELTDMTILDFSTIDVNDAENITEQVRAYGVYVSCPISGGVLTTRSGKSLALCGTTDKAVVHRISPILDSVFRKIVFFSESRSAMLAKLSNNIAVINSAIGTLEAIKFAVETGIGAQQALDTMNEGTAKGYIVESTLRRPLLDNEWEVGFRCELALKDLRIVRRIASELNITLPFTERSEKILQWGVDAGLADKVFVAAFAAHLHLAFEGELN